MDGHDLLASPEAFARHLLPECFRRGFCAFHRESMARYAAWSREPLPMRRARRVAVAAPRGSAKSTLHSLLLPLMDICGARERYVLIISATRAQAQARLRNLMAALQPGSPVCETFPESAKPQRPWSPSRLTFRETVVEAWGAGCELRGLSHGAWRPTKIILDDAEHSAVAESAARRRRLRTWFCEVVEDLGDTYTRIEVVGTILHRESLLSALLRRPDFEHALYSSILQWSGRPDLWETWRGLLFEESGDGTTARADQFLRENHSAMVTGTKVLWPERENYVDLMLQLTLRGRAAFFREKQNDPGADDSAWLHPDLWRWCRCDSTRVVLEHPPAGCDAELTRADLACFGYLDPATGEARRDGDRAAIAAVAWHASGLCIVLDVHMGRWVPRVQAERAHALHTQWRFLKFGVESVAFQSVLRTLFEDESRTSGLPLPLEMVSVKMSKRQRILQLEPLMNLGRLHFARGLPEELLEEAATFPGSRHDDGIDAVAGAIALARRVMDPSSARTSTPRTIERPARLPAY